MAAPRPPRATGGQAQSDTSPVLASDLRARRPPASLRASAGGGGGARAGESHDAPAPAARGRRSGGGAAAGGAAPAGAAAAGRPCGGRDAGGTVDGGGAPRVAAPRAPGRSPWGWQRAPAAAARRGARGMRRGRRVAACAPIFESARGRLRVGAATRIFFYMFCTVDGCIRELPALPAVAIENSYFLSHAFPCRGS